MRRESVATLRVRRLDAEWGLRHVRVKGGKTRDIPLPQVVIQFLQTYVEQHLPTLTESITAADTPLFWSSWGQRRQGKVRRPTTGKNIWRLCNYGRIIGYPMLKPHDLSHGVAMEILAQHHDLEAVRALLGHTRIDTTQTYARIRPAELKRAVEFYEGKAAGALSN
jgi:integrase/recombinase XerD